MTSPYTTLIRPPAAITAVIRPMVQPLTAVISPVVVAIGGAAGALLASLATGWDDALAWDDAGTWTET